MIARLIERAAVVAVCAIAIPARADDRVPDDLPEPPAEIVRDPPPVALPAIPAFERPVAVAPQLAADGAGGGPVMRAAVALGVRDVSVTMLNTCNRAITAQRYSEAITACRGATDLWSGNHLAWYGSASAHLARGEWQAAAAAIARAVALRPDRAMYQMYDGIARYEAATEAASGRAADPGRPAIDAARDALLRAVGREPGLWRAHYYLGRLYRDRDDVRSAAAEFALAITANPGRRDGYVALSELYRSQGVPDPALAVALRGTEHVRPTDAADLWFEAALAHGAAGHDGPAIAALGKVLELRPRDGDARLQRGRLHALRGDHAAARADLEAVIASSEPELAAVRTVAQRLLQQVDAEQHAPRSLAAQRVKQLVVPKRTEP